MEPIILLMILIGMTSLMVLIPMVKDAMVQSRFHRQVKEGDYCSIPEKGLTGRIERINGEIFTVSTWRGKMNFPKEKVYP